MPSKDFSLKSQASFLTIVGMCAHVQACNRQTVYCVPLYDSLGENAVEYIINHSESSIIFVAKDKIATLLKALPAAHKGLKTLVYWGTETGGSPETEQVCSCICQHSTVCVGA